MCAVGARVWRVSASHNLVKRWLASRFLGCVWVLVVHFIPGIWRRWGRPFFINAIKRTREWPLIVDLVERVF
jgi:hypothetical protein